MRGKFLIQKISLLIILLIVYINSVCAQKSVTFDMEVKSVDLDLLLNEDGSVDVTFKIFQRARNIDEALNFTNQSFVLIRAPDFKSIEQPTIRNLRFPNEAPYVEVTKLVPPCDKKFVFDRVNNDFIICTQLNNEGEFNFEIKHKYLKDTNCVEQELVRQNLTFVLPPQNNPYYIKITSRSNENLDYKNPRECAQSWTKNDIQNGIACELRLYKSSDEAEITYVLTGENKKIRNDLEEIKLQNKSKLKIIIPNVVVILLSILGLFGFKEKILKFYEDNRRNKIIVWALIFIMLIIYGLFFWWFL